MYPAACLCSDPIVFGHKCKSHSGWRANVELRTLVAERGQLLLARDDGWLVTTRQAGVSSYYAYVLTPPEGGWYVSLFIYRNPLTALEAGIIIARDCVELGMDEFL